MSMERLSNQVDSYVSWKRELVREITRYRSWLERNRLNSPAVDAKLERSLRVLRTDQADAMLWYLVLVARIYILEEILIE